MPVPATPAAVVLAVKLTVDEAAGTDCASAKKPPGNTMRPKKNAKGSVNFLIFTLYNETDGNMITLVNSGTIAKHEYILGGRRAEDQNGAQTGEKAGGFVGYLFPDFAWPCAGSAIA